MSAPRLFVRSARTILPRIQITSRITPFETPSTRTFSTTHTFKMPSDLKSSDINSKTDPSVARQYDEETPKDQQIKQFFEMVDGKKICMLNTYRNGVGMSLHFPSSPFH